MRGWRAGALTAGLMAVLAGSAACQAPAPLEVGTKAPGFTLPSATRAGVGPAVSLGDYKGKTVVLAFFFKARTKG